MSEYWLQNMQQQADRLREQQLLDSGRQQALQDQLNRLQALQDQLNHIRDVDLAWRTQLEADRRHDIEVDEAHRRQLEHQYQEELNRTGAILTGSEPKQLRIDERQGDPGLGSRTPGVDWSEAKLLAMSEILREALEEAFLPAHDQRWDVEAASKSSEEILREAFEEAFLPAHDQTQDVEAAPNRLRDPQAGLDSQRREEQRRDQEQVQEQSRQEQGRLRQVLAEQQERAYPIAALREYLRDRNNRVTASDPPFVHYMMLDNLWEKSLRIADGDKLQALILAREAVRSTQQPGESRDEYLARLDGIPSLAFGSEKPYKGEDKPQHFFAVAAEAYALAMIQRNPNLGEKYAKAEGIAYEVRDSIGELLRKISGGKPTGGYDLGDIHADNRGAEFGAALAASELRGDPVQPITKFLGGPAGYER